MKIAVVFLLVTLSSCFDAASVSKTDCLQQLFQDDAPLLLQNLGNLLCNYQIAKKQQNAALFLAFLNEVNALLQKVGCTVDTILGTNVTITLQDAEALGDQVAGVLFQFLEALIAKVTKILDDIPFLDDILNDKPLTGDIRDVSCEVLAGIVVRMDKILKVISDFTGELAKIKA